MIATLKGLDRRLALMGDENNHTGLRVVACEFALANIVKGRTFEGVFVRLCRLYKDIERRQLASSLSYEDNLLRRGCDDEFNIYAPKISSAFHAVTKKYI